MLLFLIEFSRKVWLYPLYDLINMLLPCVCLAYFILICENAAYHGTRREGMIQNIVNPVWNRTTTQTPTKKAYAQEIA